MNGLRWSASAWRSVSQSVNCGGLRRRLVGLLLLASVGFVLTWGVWPIFAAVELLEYHVRSSQSDILLLWNTAHEYDLSGFEILCKLAQEPDTAYHSIGFREAQGGPEKGAQYFFLVNRGLTPGQAYCFRLREHTTNNQPGEIFDQCGYGLGITPTPPMTVTITTTLTSTITGTVTNTLTSTVTAPAAFTNTLVLTMTQDLSGTAGLATATATPTVVAVSPLAPPTDVVPPTLTPTPFGFSPLEPPTSIPLVPPITDNLNMTATMTAAALATPTVTPGQTLTNSSGAMTNNGIADAANTSPTPEAVAQVETTPPPAYLVVTATPTIEALPLPPLLTPLPTATATPSFDLAAIAQPGLQNIIILLLCFTFFGASGLGILGLLTSVFYMRSRARDSAISQDHRW